MVDRFVQPPQGDSRRPPGSVLSARDRALAPPARKSFASLLIVTFTVAATERCAFEEHEQIWPWPLRRYFAIVNAPSWAGAAGISGSRVSSHRIKLLRRGSRRNTPPGAPGESAAFGIQIEHISMRTREIFGHRTWGIDHMFARHVFV